MIKRTTSFILAVLCSLCLFSCSEMSDETVVHTQSYDETRPDIPSANTSPSSSEITGEPVTQPIENKEKRLSFVCAGDNIIHEAVFTYASALGGGKYKFDEIYSQIMPILADADISYINQETAICGDDLGVSGYPAFNSPQALGDYLVDSGVDVINLANNHMFDKLLDGYNGSLAYWKTKNVFTVGAYEDQTDYDNIRIFEKDGVKIAFLSYTDFINNSKKKAYDKLKNSGDTDIVIPFTDTDRISSQIKYAKTVADLVFVSMHWGEEDEFDITSEQRSTAQAIADAGADVIIGTHPHVVQSIEYIKGKDGGETLCIYSLGNILSTMYYAQNMVGMMVSFDIVSTDGVCTIENIKAIPTVTYYEYDPENKSDAARINIKVYLMENFTQSLAESHGSNEKDPKPLTLSRLKKYITDNVDEKYLNS